jgi:hypothetical protein
MTAAEYAALYAAHGWQPLAVRANDKRPLAPGWQTADLEQVIGIMEAHPGANVGIVMPPGTMILDVDTKTGGPATLASLEATHGPLPRTLTATTPSGGRHIWFTLPPGVHVGNRVAVMPGLDVRATGGYVVAPPSSINGRAYTWDGWDCMAPPQIAEIPAWLLDLVCRPAAKAPQPSADGGPLTIPEGQRNRSLFEAGAAMRDKGFSQDAIVAALTIFNEESCTPPLEDSEIATIAASASRYAPSPQPWQAFGEPGMLPPPGAWPAEGASGDAAPLAMLESNLIPLDGLAEYADRPLPHVVDKWIPCDEVTLLAGHGGGGKSYVALLLAVHVALGSMFGQLPVTETRVLFFSAEDGAQVLRHRLTRICRALQIDPALLDGKLFLLDASDIDPALHREQRAMVFGQQVTVTQTPLLDTLAALVQKLAVGLVVVDNASDTYDDNEIVRARVRTFVRSLRSRLARPGRAVLLLAHINKASANGGRQAGTEDYSGSTAWHNSVRSRLSLAPAGADALTIEHAKANNGAKAAPVGIAWVDGVPTVAGGGFNAGAAVEAEEKRRDDGDKPLLVALIQEFDSRGENVTTSSLGSSTVFHLLKGQPGFPKDTDSHRLMRLLRAMQSDGLIYRRTVKTAQRKMKEVFTCAPDPTQAGA